MTSAINTPNDITSISFWEKNVNSTLEKTKSKAEYFINSTKELRTLLSGHYRDVGKYNTAVSISQCGTFLMFKEYKNKEKTAILEKANFCKNPLCPMCEWRKHIILEKQLKYAVKSNTDKYFYHLVLAVPNTNYIDRAMLMRLKERGKTFIQQKLNVQSYFSSLEIKYSEKGYHPHLHILFSSNDFIHISSQYIKTMAEKWKKHYNKFDKEYKTYTFYLQGVKKDDDGLFQELTKYIVKSDGIKATKQNIGELAEAIYKVRKISAGGSLRTGLKDGKTLALNDYADYVGALNEYEWEYKILQFINGKYEEK